MCVCGWLVGWLVRHGVWFLLCCAVIKHDNSRLVVLGGSGNRGLAKCDLYAFDPRSMFWQRVSADNPLPPRHSCAVAVRNVECKREEGSGGGTASQIVVVGGWAGTRRDGMTASLTLQVRFCGGCDGGVLCMAGWLGGLVGAIVAALMVVGGDFHCPACSHGTQPWMLCQHRRWVSLVLGAAITPTATCTKDAGRPTFAKAWERCVWFVARRV